MTTTVYVLELADHCWYVGKTNDVQRRFQQHLAGNGSAWTRKHRPLSISATYHNASPFDEDKVTKEYMARYGIHHVRVGHRASSRHTPPTALFGGGVYVQINLPDEQKRSIEREIAGATDRCFICGSPEQHFAAECSLSHRKSGGWMGSSVTQPPPATKEPPATQQPQQNYFSFSSLVEFISTIWEVPPSYQEYLDSQRVSATKM